MIRPSAVDVQFRLAAPALPLGVHVRMRSFGGRWVAVARIDEETQSGLGSSARQALGAALVSLPALTRAALMADLALLRPSIDIVPQAVCAGPVTSR
ncbi:MAG: hypothetical protein M3432_08915 [Chloroflexota bacterium]|nr:hypothetical protein [Chloroflexota bacterium]